MVMKQFPENFWWGLLHQDLKVKDDLIKNIAICLTIGMTLNPKPFITT